jgi:hypothetical protein
MPLFRHPNCLPSCIECTRITKTKRSCYCKVRVIIRVESHQVHIRFFSLSDIDVLFGHRVYYTREVLATVLESLIDADKSPVSVSVRVIRSLVKAVNAYQALNGFAVKVLQRLLHREIWKNERLWHAFLRACNQLAPNSLQVPNFSLPAFYAYVFPCLLSLC